YLVVYALFVGFAWRAESIATIVGGYSLAIAILGIVELAAAARSANPDSYFLVARFAKPTGYQNANAALFSLALWPALFLASRRKVPIVVRALMLGSSTALLELAVLSQSRGWLGAMPIVAVLYIALVPGRVRSIIFALPVALGFLVARRSLLDVFPALHSGEHISTSVASARNAVLVTALAVLIAGAGMAAVDRFLWPGGKRGRQLALAGAVTCAAVAAVALLAGPGWVGNPATPGRRAWGEFPAKPAPRPARTSRPDSAATGTTSGASRCARSSATPSRASARTTSRSTTSASAGPTRSRCIRTASSSRSSLRQASSAVSCSSVSWSAPCSRSRRGGARPPSPPACPPPRSSASPS